MAHTVFICHSARDKQVADAACAALEARRIPCWIAPRDILGGDEWGKAIVDAINDCRIVLLIFSAHANTSPQVRREVERAVSKAKIIVPFRIEDVLPSDAMEYALGNTHWLDALTAPVEAHLATLADTIARILQRDEPTAFVFTQPPQPRAEAPPTTPNRPGPITRDAVSNSGHTKRTWLKLTGFAAITVIFLAVGGFFLSRHLSGTRQFELNRKACDDGDFATCTSLGLGYYAGAGVSKDYPEASALFRKACDGGYAAACRDLGDMYEKGEGVPKDVAQAVALYRKACDGGAVYGCSELNYATTSSSPPIAVAAPPRLSTATPSAKAAPKDTPPAKPASVPAAKPTPTSSISPTTSLMAEDSQKGHALYSARNFEEARPFLERACNGGKMAACADLGFMYETGNAVTKDISQAVTLYRKACDGGNAYGCSILGVFYEHAMGVPKDLSQAAALYRKGCDGNDKTGCFGLGWAYETGQGAPQDKTQAVALYLKACNSGDANSCVRLKLLRP